MSVAYAPWSNGSVDSKNQQILKAIRTLTLELNLALNEWPHVLPLVEKLINSTAIPSRMNLTADELFLNLENEQRSHEDIIFGKGLSLTKLTNAARKELIDASKQFMKQMEERHARIYKATDYACLLANDKAGGPIPKVQFQAGDWAMISFHQTPMYTDKTKPIWQGPMVVLQVLSKDVYEVQSMLGKKYRVHGNRMWFYAKQNFYRPAEYVKHMARLQKTGFEIDKIEAIELRDGHV